MLDTPYSLELSDETRDAVEAAICERLKSAVDAVSSRNSDLQMWRDQLEGNGVVAQNSMWEGACDLTDPISLEAFLTVLSQLVGAMHRDPKVAVEAFMSEDEENARILEAWLSVAGNQSDVDSRLYDLAYNACRDTATVGYVGWKQETRKVREVGYKAKGSARLLTEDEKDDNQEYEEAPYQETVVSEGFDIRSVDLCDFFMYPASSVSPDRASCIAERVYLTEDELYDGIEDFGYDREAVEELCQLGSGTSASDEYRQDQEAQQGIDQTIETGNGFYEIFICYTRMPRLQGTDAEVPDYLMQQDFLVVCSPYNGIMLKMEFSPFQDRPYFVGGILPKPQKAQGHGLMEALEPLQSEANANLQFSIDAGNLAMCPAMFVPEALASKLNRYKLSPGAFVPVQGDPKELVPVQWGHAPFRDGLLLQQDIRNRAKALVSAEGQGQLTGKVRKQGEIDNIQAQTNAKFGLYLFNFQRSVVSELFRRMINLKQQFGVEEEEFVTEEGRSMTLTSQALKGKYRIVATATSLTHSPETRIEVSKAKQAAATEYLIAKSKLPPQEARFAWHGARELLFDYGERNPEAWIGEEPEIPQQQPQQQAGPMQQAPGGNGIMPMQFAQNGGAG